MVVFALILFSSQFKNSSLHDNANGMKNLGGIAVSANPPVLTNSGVVPSIGTHTMSFNFSTRYSDAGDNPPVFINVVINNTTNHMSWNNQTGNNYTAGVVYYKVISNFTTGYYVFYFSTGDGSLNTTTLTYHVNVTDTPPRLSNSGVNPAIGIPSEAYNFSTQYSDVYDHAPAIIDVVINGITHALSWNAQTGNNYTRGVVYYYKVSNFTAGYYPFYFTTGHDWFNTTTSTYHVNVTSSHPRLSYPGVVPTIGTDLLSYNFSTRYGDVYGNAPAFIDVVINSETQHLTMNAQTGSNYTRGVVYYTIISNFTVGYYSFVFKAGDGWFNTTTSTYHVNVTDTPPRLSNPSVAPAIGIPSQSYNFSTRYSDVYGNSPAFINVMINGNTQHLTRNNQTGSNYTKGVIYYTIISNFTLGYYLFNFTASDGWFTTISSTYHVNVTNTPPRLSNFGVNPIVGSPSQAYNFSARYSDAYGRTPAFIDVVINSSTQHLSRNVQTGSNYTRGVVYYTIISNFTSGNYTFFYKTGDNWFNTTTSTNKVTVRFPPQLSNAGVTPAIGIPSQMYNFSARYSDAYGTAPVFIDVVINGSTQHLSRNVQTGNNYTRGVVYYTIISNFTTYYYPFYLTTGDGWLNSTTIIYHVNVTITPPRLFNRGVNPSVGAVSMVYNFSSRYSDVYGLAPVFIDVVINGTTQHLSRNLQTGNNYTRGVVYYKIISNFTIGSYTFFFKTGDGLFNTTTSTILLKVVPAYPITSSSSYFQGFNSNYNSTTWKWTSTTNRNAWTISTTTYHSGNSSIGMQGAGIPITNPPVENGLLISPLFDLTKNFQYELTFDYLLYLGVSTLEIQVNMSGTWVVVPIALGTTGAWQQIQQNMSQYKGSYVQIGFTFTGIAGTYLYLDDFLIQTMGNATITYAAVTPYQGNLYDVFQLEIEYQDSHNILPNSLYLSIWNGNTPNVMQINFTQDNSSILTDINGKFYHCNFQVIDIANPVLWVDSDHGSWCVSKTPFFVSIDQTIPLDTTGFPLTLNFENSSYPYYTLNNYAFSSTGVNIDTIGGNNTNHYFTTGTYAGTTSGTKQSVKLGLATYLISMYSDVEVFIHFDSQTTIIGGTNSFSLDMTTDNGATWTTLWQTTAAATGRITVNLTSSKNQTASFRFMLQTSTLGGIIEATWIIDNISIYEVDTTPPTMSINISPGQVLQGTVLVNMTIHVPHHFRVVEVMILLDGISIGNITTFKNNVASIMLDTTKFSNGNHTLTIVVIDNSGNQKTYAVSVNLDNTPYLFYIIILAVIAAAVIIGVIAIKKNTRRLRNIPLYLNKRIMLKQIKPTKEIAEKILLITGIFRRITAAELARKLQLPNVTQSNVLGYLRFMLAENMIHGNIDDSTSTFTRTFPEKMKVTLDGKEGIILDYLNHNDRVEIGDLIKDLQLENVTREALEDFILGLVMARKISCYFDGNTIIKEKAPTTMTKPITVKPEHSEVTTTSFEKPEKQDRMATPASKPTKKKILAESERQVLEYLSGKSRVTFDELTEEMQLESFDRDTIEDFIVGLVGNGKIKCHFDGDVIVNDVILSEKTDASAQGSDSIMDVTTAEPIAEPPIEPSPRDLTKIKPQKLKTPEEKMSIADKKDELIELVAAREKISFDEIKDELSLDESTDAIEDFLFDLIKNREIKGIIQDDCFLSM